MPALRRGNPSHGRVAGPQRVDVGQVHRQGLAKVPNHLRPTAARAHPLVAGQITHVVRSADLRVQLPRILVPRVVGR